MLADGLIADPGAPEVGTVVRLPAPSARPASGSSSPLDLPGLLGGHGPTSLSPTAL
jgi:hypothetical protein